MAKRKKIVIGLAIAFIVIFVVVLAAKPVFAWCFISYKKDLNVFKVAGAYISGVITDKDYVRISGDNYFVKEGKVQSLIENEYQSYEMTCGNYEHCIVTTFDGQKLYGGPTALWDTAIYELQVFSERVVGF